MRKYIYSLLFFSFLFLGGSEISLAQEIQWSEPFADLSGNVINWRSVTYGYDEDGKGLFVAVGDGYDSVSGDYRGMVMTSVDGEDWSEPFADLSGKNIGWESVTHGNGKFVAVGKNYDDEKGAIMVSPDGKHWLEFLDLSNDEIELKSVTHGNGKFVAIGYNYDEDNAMIIISGNGQDWTLVSQDSDNRLDPKSISFGNGKFVVVGRNIETNKSISMTSVDGVEWSTFNDFYYRNYSKIIYSNGKFVAIGRNFETGEMLVATSLDGFDWEILSPVLGEYFHGISLTYGDRKFVVVGYNNEDGWYGTSMFSSDLVNWSVPPFDNASNIKWISVTYGNGKFVAVGHDDDTGKGMIMHSLSSTSSSTNSKVSGTRFCSAGVTTFCRSQNGFVNNNPLISVYTELLGLYQQLLSAMQGQEN